MWWRGHPIPVSQAVYDPSNETVTLDPARRLNVHRVYQLTVNGTAPGGLVDQQGRLLDGKDNGRPGSNFVSLITRATLAGPAPSTIDPIAGRGAGLRRWIAGTSVKVVDPPSALPHRARSEPRVVATAVDQLAMSGELTAGTIEARHFQRLGR